MASHAREHKRHNYDFIVIAIRIQDLNLHSRSFFIVAVNCCRWRVLLMCETKCKHCRPHHPSIWEKKKKSSDQARYTKYFKWNGMEPLPRATCVTLTGVDLHMPSRLRCVSERDLCTSMNVTN